MDVYSSLLPILRVARALAVAPFSLGGHLVGAKLAVWRRAVVYSACVCCGLTALFSVTVINLHHEYHRNTDGHLQAIVSYSQIGYDVVLSVLLIVTSGLTADRFISLMAGIDQVDVTLAALQAPASRTGFRRFSNLLLLLSGLMFTLNYCLLIYILDTGTDTLTFTLAMYWTMYQITKPISYAFVCLFMGLLVLLKHRFKAINLHLAQCVDIRRALLEAREKGLVLWSPMLTSLSSLQRFRKLHCDLCDLTQQVNTNYSFQILLCVTSIFVNLTTELNYVIVQLLKYSMSLPDFAHSTVLIATVALQVIFVGASCTLTSKEADRTAVVLHKLLAHTKEVKTRKELRVFSMQLVHRKVRFTACGFFPLDATLLYGIVGGVTTYLVIIIQFQISADPQLQNHTQTATTFSTNN